MCCSITAVQELTPICFTVVTCPLLENSNVSDTLSTPVLIFFVFFVKKKSAVLKNAFKRYFPDERVITRNFYNVYSIQSLS